MGGETRTGTVVAWTSDLKVSPETRAKLHEQSLAALARARADRDEETERLAYLKSPPRAPNEAAVVIRAPFVPDVELARSIISAVRAHRIYDDGVEDEHVW